MVAAGREHSSKNRGQRFVESANSFSDDVMNVIFVVDTTSFMRDKRQQTTASIHMSMPNFFLGDTRYALVTYQDHPDRDALRRFVEVAKSHALPDPDCPEPATAPGS